MPSYKESLLFAPDMLMMMSIQTSIPTKKKSPTTEEFSRSLELISPDISQKCRPSLLLREQVTSTHQINASIPGSWGKASKRDGTEW